MVEEETLGRGLTQYLESQDDQDMTRLLNFLEFKRGEEMGFFLSWNEGDGGFI